MPLDKSGLAAKLDQIQNLDDVRAVAPGVDVEAADRQEGSSLAAEHGLNPGDAKAFENAGWTFVRAGQVKAGQSGAPVVVDADGHLKVVGHALNVKFEPSLSRDAAEGILGRYGLSIRRAMGFSPNLFLVDGAQDDMLSKAKSLNQLDDVVYAEPVLIEPIQGRR
jgi:hypothetical protein